MSDLKNDFTHPKEAGHFIKVTDFPVSGLTSEQKVVLNRKGNIFFNQGKILEARRLFITTGYSDGLNRVAEKSMESGNELDALKLYLLAHNKRNAQPLIEKLANIISSMMEDN